MTEAPIVAAFLFGVGFGFVLNVLLRWVVNVRFRVARWYRAAHGVR